MAWQGTKFGVPVLAVLRKKDGNKLTIAAADFDDAVHEVDGDGTVPGYDPTETAEDVVNKQAEEAVKALHKAAAEQAVADAAKAAKAPAPKRGRPRSKKE